MRQTWHIFLKDARRLRYDIIVTLIITAAFAWCTAHRCPIFENRVDVAAQWLTLLLPIAWWYLVARAIYGESPAGDRQFWVTRPYRWTSLLAAKFLFIAVFITMPFLLSDCAILALQGFHPSDYLAGLAWHPLVMSVVILLPVAALASITESLAEVTLAVLAVMAVLILPSVLFGIAGRAPWEGSRGLISSSEAFLELLAIALTILILQYRSRRTGLSRILAGAYLGLGFIPFSLVPPGAARAVESWFFKSETDTTSISLQFQPRGHPPAKVKKMDPDNRVPVILPIAYSGVPSGEVAIGGMEVKIILPNGQLSEPQPMREAVDDKSWSWMFVEPALYGRVKNTSLRLHVTLFLTLYGNPHTESMPVEGHFVIHSFAHRLGVSDSAGPHHVPGIGVCASHVFDTYTLARCFVPFRLPDRTLAQVDNGTPLMGQGEYGGTPYPASLGISPMDRVDWQFPVQTGATAIVFTTWQPLAHIRRELDIPNVRLADFAY
jgi:hypothetical protein